MEVGRLLGFDEIPEVGWAGIWLTPRRVVAAVDSTFLVGSRRKNGCLRPAVWTTEGLRVRNPRVKMIVIEVALLSSEVCGRPGELRSEGWTVCDGHEVETPCR